MTCAACVGRVERAIVESAQLPPGAVRGAKVALLTETAEVLFDPSKEKGRGRGGGCIFKRKMVVGGLAHVPAPPLPPRLSADVGGGHRGGRAGGGLPLPAPQDGRGGPEQEAGHERLPRPG